MMRCFLMGLLAVFPLTAQINTNTSCGDDKLAGRFESGMRPPELRPKRDPTYTDEAIRQHRVGNVNLCLVIEIDGRSSNISVLREMGAGLDEAAVEAARQWRFIPAIRETGEATRVWVELTVNFVDPPGRDAPPPIHGAIPAKYSTPAPPAILERPSLSLPPTGPALEMKRAPAQRLLLDDATPIKLRTSRNLSSADTRTGDMVDFEVLEEVKVDNRIIVAKGAIAIGSITNAEAKRRMGRGGKLDVMIEFVKLADGEKAALRGIRESKGGGHTGGMTTGMVVTGLVFWPAAPLFLFIHGKDITIPKGTEITAYTNGTMTLDGERFRLDVTP